MRKLKELNLTVGTTPDVSPIMRKRRQSGGGLDNSADNIIGGRMSYIDKSEEFELEELEDEDLLKEFLSLGNLGNLAQSAAFSIPGIGDAAAFIKFLFKIYGPDGLKAHSEDFTDYMYSLTDIDVGGDFLEPEGGILKNFELDDGSINENAAISAFDASLVEAVNRIKFPKDYEGITIHPNEIKQLRYLYRRVLKDMKQLLISFIGFADVIAGQKGFYINAILSFTPAERIPDFVVRKYARHLAKFDNTMIGRIKEKVFELAEKASMPLDYLGNLDLLFNLDKLRRLSLIDSIFEYYEDYGYEVPEDDETYQRKIVNVSALPDEELPVDKEEDEEQGYLDKAKDYVTGLFSENYDTDKFIYETFVLEKSLRSLYEEDEEDIDEISSGGVAGAATPLGTKSDGKKETEKERKDRVKKADIYREHLRHLQDWKHATSGRRK